MKQDLLSSLLLQQKHSEVKHVATWFAPPSTPDFSGKFKPCFRAGYFLLQLSEYMMGTCMLLAGVRVHEHLWHQYKPLGWEWGFKKCGETFSILPTVYRRLD